MDGAVRASRHHLPAPGSVTAAGHFPQESFGKIVQGDCIKHAARLTGVSAQHQLNPCCIFNLFIARCAVCLC